MLIPRRTNHATIAEKNDTHNQCQNWFRLKETRITRRRTHSHIDALPNMVMRVLKLPLGFHLCTHHNMYINKYTVKRGRISLEMCKAIGNLCLAEYDVCALIRTGKSYEGVGSMEIVAQDCAFNTQSKICLDSTLLQMSLL